MNKVHVYCLRHSYKLEENVFQNYVALLPETFRSEIRAYKHWESAQASLLGRIVLLHAFEKAGWSYSLNDIRLGNKERPYIENAGIDFNISHSGEYVVVALTNEGKVGIDVEKHRKLDINLFRKYFDDGEWGWIEASLDPEKSFFDLWAAKESAIKCDGRGVEVLSDTHVLMEGGEALRSISCRENIFYINMLQIDPQYACCVCTSENSSIILEHLTPEALEIHP